MLIFTLKKEWYEKILSGEKTIEYRREVRGCTVCLDKTRCGKYNGEGGICPDWRKQWK